ncbi:FAD linked oxidase [Cinnamomum micranthum f. kanehirae]|uniref:FAD linked oxidase n=1 Tax=Cinnamomum micranthum f. kanehirae TaxID=337451 RepID=A0A3S3QPS8_9MAGN|nr:FAD linked oxidase [Cinnamomum micranthum f. kanehirae]
MNILGTQPKGHVIFDAYGRMMSRIESNALPFPHRDGNLYGIQYLVHWDEEDDGRSGEYIYWLQTFYHHMGPFASKGPRAAYVNYVDLDLGVFNGSTKHNAV